MTPRQLVLLLKIFEGCDAGGAEDLSTLIDEGLLVCESSGYEVTAKGEIYVEMLINTPLPIQLWRDPRLC